MTQFLLVENHVAFRECLALLIASRLNCANIQAGTPEEARRILADSDGKIGLSLIDLDLPSDDAVELIEELLDTVSGAPVLAFTDGRNPRARARAFRAGAAEVLTLSETAECFVGTAGRLGGATQRGYIQPA